MSHHQLMSSSTIMSEHKPSGNFQNRYDNASLQPDRKVKDIGAAYVEYDEQKALKLYLETLALEAELTDTSDKGTSGKTLKVGTDGQPVPVASLVPTPSPFERARRGVLVKLNAMPGNAKQESDLKRLMAEFESESIWDLSRKLTNFLMDKQRRDKVHTDFNSHFQTGK